MKSRRNSEAEAIRRPPAPGSRANQWRCNARSSPRLNARSTRRDNFMQEFSAFDGAILIDKPSGPTSHDVVDAIRRQFRIKKVGHCGTLDPNATGLLIIVLG